VSAEYSDKVVDLKGLQVALKELYHNRERCIIEFEELVRNLYALNKSVLDKMMINLVLKYHSKSEKVVLLSTSGNYLQKYRPVKGKHLVPYNHGRDPRLQISRVGPSLHKPLEQVIQLA
jgi:hypothetical protein